MQFIYAVRAIEFLALGPVAHTVAEFRFEFAFVEVRKIRLIAPVREPELCVGVFIRLWAPAFLSGCFFGSCFAACAG